MKKAPKLDGAGKEYMNALERLYSTPPRSHCTNCGIPTHRKLCPTCYRWHTHFAALQQAMRALRGGL